MRNQLLCGEFGVWTHLFPFTRSLLLPYVREGPPLTTAHPIVPTVMSTHIRTSISVVSVVYQLPASRQMRNDERHDKE